MMDFDREARALAARVRRRDGPSPADRARLRARLEPIWAEQRASEAVGSGDAAAPIGLAASRFPLVSIVFLAAVSFWASEQPSGQLPLVATSESLPSAAPASSTANPAPGHADPASIPESVAHDRTMLEPTGRNSGREAAATGDSKARHTGGDQAAGVRGARGRGLAGRSPAGGERDASAPVSKSGSSVARLPESGSGESPELQSAPLAAPGGDDTTPRESAASRERTGAQPEPARVGDSKLVRRGRAFTPQPIDDELSWLGSAQEALSRGEPSAALRLVQQHAFRYPQGALANERRAIQALALCALQRKAAARSVLSDLERTSSPLVERVRLKCKL